MRTLVQVIGIRVERLESIDLGCKAAFTDSWGMEGMAIRGPKIIRIGITGSLSKT